MGISGIGGSSGNYQFPSMDKQAIIKDMKALLEQFRNGNPKDPHGDFLNFLDKYNALSNELSKLHLTKSQKAQLGVFENFFGILATGGEGNFALTQNSYQEDDPDVQEEYTQASSAIESLVNSL